MKNLFNVILAYAIDTGVLVECSDTAFDIETGELVKLDIPVYAHNNGTVDIIKIKHLIDENDYNDIIDYYKNKLDCYKNLEVDFNHYITITELLDDIAKIYKIDFTMIY